MNTENNQDKIIIQIPANTIIEITRKLSKLEDGMDFTKEELKNISDKVKELSEDLSTLKLAVRRNNLWNLFRDKFKRNNR